MTRARKILEDLATLNGEVTLTSDGIQKEFEKRLKMFGLDMVQVDDVDVDPEGDIAVTFSDDEGDQVEVVFLVDDEEDDIIAIVNDQEDEEDGDGEVTVVDLSPLNPSVLSLPGRPDFVNLIDLSWMNKSTMVAILSSGDVDFPGMGDPVREPGDDHPFTFHDSKPIPFAHESLEEEIDEAGSTRVVRGGKVVRLPLVRRKRRRVLSAKAKAGIRRAVIKRKAKKSTTARKRKRALRIRKSQNISRRKSNTRNLKVQGGADRRR